MHKKIYADSSVSIFSIELLGLKLWNNMQRRVGMHVSEGVLSTREHDGSMAIFLLSYNY